MNGRRLLPRALPLSLAALLAGTAHADFTVSGTFRYADRAFTISGFTGAEPAVPVRLATVQVVDDGTGQVLATGATGEDGTFSIPVAATGFADVVVRCFSRSNQFGAQAVRVTDASGVEYSVSSAVFAGWNLSSNLDAGVVTAQKVFSGSYQGGPFNMLDMAVHAVQYVKAQGSGNPSGSIRVLWPGGSGSYASGLTANMSNDDGFDDLVILHELGHVIHNVYSDSDSPGGSHSFGQSDQDPRLSLGEGWASFFAGAVRERVGLFDPGFYIDCAGQGQTGSGSVQLRMRHENGWPYGGTTAGEADEGAVFCVLWDVVDDAATNDGNGTDDDALDGSLPFNGGIDGHRMLWQAFIGPVKAAPSLTIRDFWNGQFTPVGYGQGAALEAVYAGWEMRFFADDVEPNGSLGAATALAPATAWGPIRTLYWGGALAAPGDDDQDHYAFTMLTGATFEVETRYPNGSGDAETYCDPYLTVYRPDGAVFAQSDSGGTGRNAKLSGLVADASGTWTARVHSVHSYRRTGSYQVRVVETAPPPSGCANQASSSSSGTGKPGANGTPSLVALTPPVVGGPGLLLSVASGPPALSGLFFVGTQTVSIPFDGGMLLVDPLFTLPVATSGTGDALLAIPLTDPALCGVTVHLQALFPNDPGASGFYATSQSNRLTLTFGA